jgi:hypothetical protein
MISISDDIMVRILSPRATVALVMALIHALGAYVPVRLGGALSGSF